MGRLVPDEWMNLGWGYYPGNATLKREIPAKVQQWDPTRPAPVKDRDRGTDPETIRICVREKANRRHMESAAKYKGNKVRRDAIKEPKAMMSFTKKRRWCSPKTGKYGTTRNDKS